MDGFKVAAGSKLNLSQRDPRDTGDFNGSNNDGLEATTVLNQQLETWQELLYAE